MTTTRGVGKRILKGHLAQNLVTSRLLVLQSKRLVLNTLLRRQELAGADNLLQRIERKRVEVDDALHSYRRAMLAYGATNSPDYWLIAYASLIDRAGALSRKMVSASAGLPAQERYEASADVEVLEHIVDSWKRSMRTAMGQAVA